MPDQNPYPISAWWAGCVPRLTANSDLCAATAADGLSANRLKRLLLGLPLGTFLGILLGWLVGWIVAIGNAHGDDFGKHDRLFRQLTAPMTSVVDGRSFRNGLESISGQAGLNLHLDRQVDPSVLIDTGPVGPTVYAAISQLAASQDCVVLPLVDVVLVGREAWVDRTATSLLSIPKAKLGDVIDVTWPDLTTPQQALRLAAGDSVGTLPSLPHDLWPAVQWQRVDRRVAVALVLSQFDEPRASNGESPQASETFSRRYSLDGADSSAIRTRMLGVDPSSQLRVSGDWMVTKGTAKSHRAAIAAMLEAAGNVAGPDPDRDRFTLKKMTTTAENAFLQLAQAAHRRCVIESNAAEACKSIVSIEGRELSLRQLIDLVAKQVGVTVHWQETTIVISSAR